ncbi:uncharacterized mitochondrial protein AtMg00810-like [Hibiscus syriacus]|uniref:uncharacterized mitochondrial protein AtMg00810-like n=1 Tax=Hibiscus syriacus TaxID=106335 RepID=UPI001920E8D8|nr:uncharacterized mitochondrial protein AtMg00810-like [Hibiscus syriacus]
MVTVRTVMALAFIHQWPLLQMDVYNTFLQGDLVEENKRLISEDKLLKDKTSYQRLIGKLIYLINTRPDIAYSVQLLSQFMQQPRKLYLDAALRVVRRSVTGFCVKLGDSSLSWKSKKQNTIARSSTEEEYRSMAITAVEIVWLTGLLNELRFKNT